MMHPARSRRRPAFAKALNHLHGLMGTPGSALAGVRQLADDADVSFVTMCTALRHLRAEGMVTLRNRRAYLVSPAAGVGNPTEKQPSAGVRQERPSEIPPPSVRAVVAERVRQDIRNGVFRPGAPLPSTKELGARYRVSYRPLRDALRALAREQSLQESPNGGFAVAGFPSARWKLRIICITPSSDGRTMALGQHDEALFRALESFCELSQIKLDTILLYYSPEHDRDRYRYKNSESEMDYPELARIGDESVLGFLFFIPWEPHGVITRAISHLLQNRRPMVVIDETARLNLSDVAATSTPMRVLTGAASPAPGIAVGRRLIGLGHRRIAFASVNHSFYWSQSRLAGLSLAYADAAIKDGVIALVADTGPDTKDHPVQRRDSALAVVEFGKLRRRISPALRPDFDPLYARHACQKAESRLLLHSLLDSAVADPSITAWAMVNDASAVMALAYLRDKGIRVPQDLSVVSFDDSVEALRNNLSSYNFNAPAVANAIVGFMLGRRPFEDPSAEVAGYVVDRGTVGPPSGRAA